MSTTLAEIRSSLQSLVNRRDFTANTALQTTFINQGMLRIQRELRIPDMETVNSTFTITANMTAGITIPSDFVELIRIVPENTWIECVKSDYSRVRAAQKDIAGDPTEYCRQGTKWILAPAPAVGDVIDVDYYSKLPAFANEADSNTFSNNNWDLILYASASLAAEYYSMSENQQMWESHYQRVKSDLENAAEQDEMMANTRVMPCLLYPGNDSELIWDYDND